MRKNTEKISGKEKKKFKSFQRKSVNIMIHLTLKKLKLLSSINASAGKNEAIFRMKHALSLVKLKCFIIIV